MSGKIHINTEKMDGLIDNMTMQNKKYNKVDKND